MPTMETETAMSPLEYQKQDQEKIELSDDDKKQNIYKKLMDTERSKSSMSEKHSHEKEERSKEYKVLKESSDPSTQPEEECLIRSRKRRPDSPRADCTPSKMAPAEETFQYDLDWELHKFTADVGQTKQEQQEDDEEQTQRPEGRIYDRISQYVSTNMSTTSTSFFANYCAAEKSKSFAQLNEEELFGENSDSHSDSENKPKPTMKPKKSEELLHSESKANQLQQQQRKEQQQLQLQLRKYETLHEKLAQKHEDMLKIFQQMLIKLLRQVSVEITKELSGKAPTQETFNPKKLDETWCLPYGSDSKVIVKSSKEGIMSIRVEPLMPMHLRTSRTRRSERREDDCKPRTEQWIEQQSIDPESFAEQQLYKEPTEHYQEYPSPSDYDNDSEDQSNDDGDNNIEANRNNNNTNAVEVENPFDVYNDHIETDWNNLHSVDNTVAVDMELDSDCGSNWSGSKTLCSDKSESTLQLEISDREYQRLLQRSRIECFEQQHKLDIEDRSRQM